jgi:hypothetical protein
MQILEEWLGVSYNDLQLSPPANGHEEAQPRQQAYNFAVDGVTTNPPLGAVPLELLSHLDVNQNSLSHSPTNLIDLFQVLYLLSPEQQASVILAMESIIKVSSFMNLSREK